VTSPGQVNHYGSLRVPCTFDVSILRWLRSTEVGTSYGLLLDWPSICGAGQGHSVAVDPVRAGNVALRYPPPWRMLFGMKILLTVSAVVEGGTGLVLVAFPTPLAVLLLGSSLDTPAALTVARLAGVALLALGSVCWRSRLDGRGSAAKGAVVGMVIYNAGVFTVLVHADISLGLSGIGLWPVVLVHAVMAAWCVMTLSRSDATAGS